eukprot:Protomagalhaensia_sp_Gyna_25__1418@NODE_1716_length_1591_cov_68_583763_g1406_i0_p1_GENE_NODE_1716_length_1591_cov_68_583763_g1406_i0NODE_1716_length_1591_cov_68_583763_g1406_i0_p1_ORF_typecomplete_len338_score52_57UPF0561/PF10573_9/1e02UPF0561/PF10573_9/5_2_NODE_1716_length_1591_cov_68_583763_g1406_i05191532
MSKDGISDNEERAATGPRQLFDADDEVLQSAEEEDDDALLGEYPADDYDQPLEQRSRIIEREIPTVQNKRYNEERPEKVVKCRTKNKKGGKKSDREGKEQSEFDRIMESAKMKRKKKHITQEEAANRAQSFLSRMRDAADQDELNLASGLPAVAKLAILDEVCIEIVKPAWTAWYLQEGLLSIIERWLTPLPDGGLPNLTLRTKLLATLTKIHCSADYMANTTLGERLLELWRSPEESEENRQSIRKIVNMLIKPILGLRYNSAAHTNDFPHVERVIQPSLRASTFRAAPPHVQARQFRVAPKSQILEERQAINAEDNRIQRIMDSKLRKRKATRNY